MTTFKERIYELWEKAKDENYKITQTEFAAQFGATRNQLKGWIAGTGEPNSEMLKKIAERYNVSTDFLLGKVHYQNSPQMYPYSDPQGVVQPSTEPDHAPAVAKISDALESDPELLAFWNDLSRREDLQLLFRQTKSMTPETIRKVMRIIKAIEDEEAGED